MARPVSNVNIATDSFSTWVGVTNYMADTFTNYAVTANSSTVGATVSGNASVVGIFNANTIAAGSELRGGTVNASANLNISTNTNIAGAVVNISSNMYVLNSNTNINSASFYVVSGTTTANLVTVSSIFNSNSGVANTTEIITTTAQHSFSNSDIVVYSTSAGNTVISGLANNTTYFVVNATPGTSTLQLATTLGGSPVNISAGVNETGHTITRQGRFNVNGGLANITSNVSVLNTNTYINTASFSVVGGLANVTSNVTITNANTYVNATTIAVTGNLANITSTTVSVVGAILYINATSSYVTGTLANVTSNVSITNTNTSINAVATYIVGGTANVTSNVTVTNANTNINATSFGVQGVSTITGNTILRANSTLTNISLFGNTTISNLAISVNQTTIGGNVNVDTGTLFVDASNNRIGINNTTPDADLTITGSANISSALRIGTTLNVVNATSISNNLTVTGVSNVSSSFNVGANVNVSTSQLNIGNITSNAVLTQTSLVIGTTTSNTLLNASSLTLGNTTSGTANVFALNVGANVNASTTQLNIGNTTVNTVISSNSIRVGNTTVNTIITGSTISTNGTLAVTGATTLTGALSTTSNTNLQTDVVLAVIANTNLGSNTTAALEIFNFPVATYPGVKITARITSLSGANTAVQEVIIAQNQTDVMLTVYGTVSIPIANSTVAAANLGAFSATINTTAIAVNFQQTGANSSVKLFTQLIK